MCCGEQCLPHHSGVMRDSTRLLRALTTRRQRDGCECRPHYREARARHATCTTDRSTRQQRWAILSIRFRMASRWWQAADARTLSHGCATSPGGVHVTSIFDNAFLHSATTRALNWPRPKNMKTFTRCVTPSANKHASSKNIAPPSAVTWSGGRRTVHGLSLMGASGIQTAGSVPRLHAIHARRSLVTIGVRQDRRSEPNADHHAKL